MAVEAWPNQTGHDRKTIVRCGYPGLLKSLEERETDIGSEIKQETVYTLECFFCGKTSEWSNMTPEEAKLCFLNEGWRYISSEKRKREGVACPECARTER